MPTAKKTTGTAVLDLRTMRPKPRPVIVETSEGVKEFDVARIPLGLASELMAANAVEYDDPTEEMRVVKELVAAIFNVSDPSVDVAWLDENLTMDELFAIITYIGEGFMVAAGGEAESRPTSS